MKVLALLFLSIELLSCIPKSETTPIVNESFQKVFSVASRPRHAECSDMDGDGDIDIILAASSGVVQVFTNESKVGKDLSFKLVKNISYPTAYGLKVIDYDSGGKKDFLISSLESNRASVFINKKFPEFEEINLGTDFLYAYDVSGGDISGDGKPDVVVAAFTSGQIHYMENKENSSAKTLIVSNAAPGVQKLDVMDVDGDGDTDIVAAARQGNQILFFETQKKGQDLVWQKHIVSASLSSPNFVRATDIDGDGLVDIIASSRSSSKIYLLRNAADNTQPWKEFSIKGNGVYAVDAKDLNGDGIKDLVSASIEDASVTLHLSKGSISDFEAVSVDTRLPGAQDVKYCDFDNDGLDEVMAVGSQGPGYLRVYKLDL